MLAYVVCFGYSPLKALFRTKERKTEEWEKHMNGRKWKVENYSSPKQRSEILACLERMNWVVWNAANNLNLHIFQ
jgi:transcriptional regulator with GAF, ATPase, and Fis domain